jgi:hypothetical protein
LEFKYAVFRKTECSATEKSGVDCVRKIVKIVWFLPTEYYDRNRTFFQHFVHTLSPIPLKRNTMVSGIRRVCRLREVLFTSSTVPNAFFYLYRKACQLVTGRACFALKILFKPATMWVNPATELFRFGLTLYFSKSSWNRGYRICWLRELIAFSRTGIWIVLSLSSCLKFCVKPFVMYSIIG